MSGRSASDEMTAFHGFAMPAEQVQRIKDLVAAAPELTVEQRERLRVLLRPVNAGHHEDGASPRARNQRRDYRR